MDTIHVKRKQDAILGIRNREGLVPEGLEISIDHGPTDKVSRGETKGIGDDDVEGMYCHGIVMR